MSQLNIPTRAKWGAWLAKNHDKVDVVWLVFYKKHTGKKWLSYDDALDEALCYGWIDSLVKKLDADRYLRKFTPRNAKSSWSTVNKKRIEKLQAAGRLAKPGKQALKVAQENGSWEITPDGEKPFSMPEELQTLLDGNRTARTNFEALAKSYREQFVFWVAAAKRTTTRQRRAQEAIEKLSRGEKLGQK